MLEIGSIVNLKDKDGINVLYGVRLSFKDGNNVTLDDEHNYILSDNYKLEKWEVKKGDLIWFKYCDLLHMESENTLTQPNLIVCEVLKVNDVYCKVNNGLICKNKVRPFKYDIPSDFF